jgi:hypothetical protein
VNGGGIKVLSSLRLRLFHSLLDFPPRFHPPTEAGFPF